MPIIGITGAVCSGKSTVLGYLKSLGLETLDVDKFLDTLYTKTHPVYKKVIEIFGSYILDTCGNIDRSKLRNLVFSSSQKLKALNTLTHPYMIDMLKKYLDLKKSKNIAVEVPLLFEEKLESLFDCIIVVSASLEKIYHFASIRGLSREEVNKILTFQYPLNIKEERADFVIKNEGTKEELKRKVEEVWRKIINQN